MVVLRLNQTLKSGVVCWKRVIYFVVLGAESFDKDIGSQTGIVSDSRENSLYSALWVAQALLRKG